MAIYMIVTIEEIFDMERYQGYVQQVSDIVMEYGGKYLARGGETTTFTGGWSPKRVILIEFPDMELARACFTSDAYRAIASLREESTVSKALFVEGCE